MRISYNILFEKPERKRPFPDLDVEGRIMLKCCGMDSSGSGQGGVVLVNTVMSLQVP
jgi:hypothetical protein